MKSKPIYFPGLNGIRFIAALAVIITHVESFKRKSELPNIHKFTHFLGHEGVNVFFVLSGFLITFLLLEELKQTKSVKIKNFYIRRILRIWPLYFLILVLGYFVFPYVWYPDFFELPNQNHLIEKTVLNTLFLPNLTLYIYGSFFATGILWSIGVEEQFYIFWPWLVKKWKSIKSIILFLLVFVSIRYICFLLSILLTDPNAKEVFKIAYLFLQHDSILIGGLFAFLFFKKHKLIHKIYSIKIQIAALIVPILSISLSKLLAIDWQYLASPIHSTCYAILVLNISTNNKSLIKLENRLFNYLGKISFGLYMYHSILIFAVMTAYKKLDVTYSLTTQILMYIMVISATVAVASFSYRFLEKPLLRYKKGFMTVKSSHSKKD